MTEPEPFTLPYMNVFLYASGDVYSVDFYCDVEEPNYANLFRDGWRQLERRAPARPRSTILFFTECPRCGVRILTNRDNGADLRCKRCGTESVARRAESTRLTALLDHVHRALGREIEPIDGRRLVLLLQVLDSGAGPEVAGICSAMGFTPLEPSHAIAANLWFEGVRRRILEQEVGYSVWEKTAEPGSVGYVGETAPDIEAVLRAVSELAVCRSMSSTYDPSDETTEGLILRGEHAAVEARLGAELATNPRDTAALDLLIEALIAQGKLDDAHEKALVATRLQPEVASRWTTLGRIESRRGRHHDAVAAFERALGLDPVDRWALLFLSHAYAERGENEKADAATRRLHALGGPM